MRTFFRVVVGNEPRYYREALVAAFRCLRPHLDVLLVEPADLDDVSTCRGDVVVCSHLSQAIRSHALAWIVLYPEAENRAVIGLAGRERSVASADIDDLLDVIDEAERLTRVAAPDRAYGQCEPAP